MYYLFHNNCRKDITIICDHDVKIHLPPYETRRISSLEADNMTLVVKIDGESEAVKEKSYYKLLVETKYIFANLEENTEFFITRERTPFAVTASYDRLFLRSSSGQCIGETHRIVDEPKIKEVFESKQKREALLDAVMSSPFLTVAVIILPILLALCWGWKIGLIAFLLLLAFWGIVNILSNLFTDGILAKLVGIPSDKREFYRYFESDFIGNYYSTAKREPLYGEVEIN